MVERLLPPSGVLANFALNLPAVMTVRWSAELAAKLPVEETEPESRAGRIVILALPEVSA